jgi:transcription initiation factor TFIIIB Brf1 subunit/transcription initiation factor TFIIB
MNLFDQIDLFEEDTKACKDEEKRCFSCNSMNIEFRHREGEFVCCECGVILCIITDKTSSQSEGQAINIYLPQSSLGTTVSGKKHSKLKTVNSWLKWVYKEKIFFDDTRYIEEICYAAKFKQSVVDNAIYLYKKVSETNTIIRGLKRKGVMSACVYYGAQKQHQSYTVVEISKAFNVDRNYVSKGCKILNDLVQVNTCIVSNLSNNSQNSFYEFAERYCIKLGLDEKHKLQILKITSNIHKLQIATHFQPSTVAIASLLLLNDPDLSKKHLSSVFKISESTINKAFKTIHPWIEIISDSAITEEYLKSL